MNKMATMCEVIVIVILTVYTVFPVNHKPLTLPSLNGVPKCENKNVVYVWCVVYVCVCSVILAHHATQLFQLQKIKLASETQTPLSISIAPKERKHNKNSLDSYQKGEYICTYSCTFNTYLSIKLSASLRGPVKFR